MRNLNRESNLGFGNEDEIPQKYKYSLRDILHVIFKRKFQIFVVFSSCFIVVIVGTFFIKPIYQSKAQILVKLGRENIYVPATGSASPIINFRQEEQINSEIEILKSRTLSEKVIAKIGPDDIYPSNLISQYFQKISGFIGFQKVIDAIAYIIPAYTPSNDPNKKALRKLQKNLSVESVKNSNLIEVTFDHKNPQMAANVVNNIVSFFLDRHVEIFRTPQSYDFFQQQSQYLKEKLNESEEKLQLLKEQHKVTDLNNQQSLLLSRITEIRSELERALSREAELSQRIDNLHFKLTKLPKSIPQTELSDSNDFLISNLESRLADLQIEEKKLSIKYVDNSRPLIDVRAQIAMIRKQLDEGESKRYSGTSYGINPTYLHLQEDQFRSEAELSSVKAKRKSLYDQHSSYEKELSKLNQIETKLTQLAREVNVDLDNYRLYLSKFEESRIQSAMDSQKIIGVSLIEPAYIPHKPIKPRIILNIVIGFFLGIFCALGLAFFAEHVSDVLERTDDVEAVFELPVLCVVTEQKKLSS